LKTALKNKKRAILANRSLFYVVFLILRLNTNTIALIREWRNGVFASSGVAIFLLGPDAVKIRPGAMRRYR